MTSPLPANNPAFKNSLFPNAIDSLHNQPDPETADAVMAIQASLIGGASGGAPSAPPVPALSSATLSATTSVTVGGVTILAGNGVPAAGLGANGNYYFNSGASGANTHIYFKSAGAWAGIV